VAMLKMDIVIDNYLLNRKAYDRPPFCASAAEPASIFGS
jgi:hypothetical protein